jgi:hypothetical protein
MAVRRVTALVMELVEGPPENETIFAAWSVRDAEGGQK